MKNSTLKIENNKDFKVELNNITKLNSLDNSVVKIVGHEDLKANLSKRNNTFKLTVNARLTDKRNEDINLSFALDGDVYITEQLGNISNRTECIKDKSIEFETSIELNSFTSEVFKKESKYKAFFRTDISEIKTFHKEFETITHQRQGREYFYDCLRIKLNQKEYDVTQLKYEDKGFYIFESLQEQSYDEFSNACFSMQQAIGFINKLMVGGEKIVFDNEGGVYYTNYIRPTIKGMYSPITTNPYSYLDIDRKIADFYFPKLTRISLENLSNLVYKIHTEPEFSTAILVILEVTSIRSLLLIPSSFAVIVEQLSKHLSEEEFGLETPIPNQSLARKIIKELHIVIDNNKNTITDNSVLKLKRRLNEINKPTNKKYLTNNERLTRPFEQLGIALTLHDIAIIDVSAKLYTLISKLILKSIGYSGYVYNQSKFLEKCLNFETGEKYFEKI